MFTLLLQDACRSAFNRCDSADKNASVFGLYRPDRGQW